MSKYSLRAYLELDARGPIAFEEQPPVAEHAMNEIRGGTIQDHEVDGEAQHALELDEQIHAHAVQGRGRLATHKNRDVDVAVVAGGASGAAPEEAGGDDIGSEPGQSVSEPLL